MSVLSGPQIRFEIERGRITIDPTPEFIGPNSVDLHLGGELKVYGPSMQGILNPAHPPPLQEHLPFTNGTQPHWVLYPGKLYFGVTRERVACQGCTFHLDLRSSAGRLGLISHAGIGDDGWDGHLTVELSVVEPLLVWEGMRLFQLTFWDVVGERDPYKGRYQGATGIEPSKISQ